VNLRPTQADIDHHRYAGLVSRLAGLIVDGAIITAVVFTVVSAVPAMWDLIAGPPPGWLTGAVAVGGAALPVGYFAGCWWMTGQTLGGLLFGTVVRRADGSHLHLVRALLRAFIGLVIPVIWLIGMITVLWDDRRRALHDRLFGTVVNYRARPSISRWRERA
jgi:uncharacterized RDD family membrane protein YckC